MAAISRTSRSSPAQDPIRRLDIFDCQSLFEMVDVIRQYKSLAGADQTGPPPSFDYRACSEILQQTRTSLGFAAAENSLALATVDLESEGQGRFLTAISKVPKMLVEPVDFRDASVTLPLIGDGDRSERRYLRSLAPNITYVFGLLAGRGDAENGKPAEVIVVTRIFELFGSLRDFVQKRQGKAAIAFFRRFLDPRYGLAGLFDADSPVKFIDLDPHSETLVGTDVRQIGTGVRSARTQGISGL